MSPKQWRTNALVERLSSQLEAAPIPSTAARPGPFQRLSGTTLTPPPTLDPAHVQLVAGCRELAETTLPTAPRSVQDGIAVKLLEICERYQQWYAGKRA
jgi:hypothetical protein